jgi:hypothetical protein
LVLLSEHFCSVSFSLCRVVFNSSYIELFRRKNKNETLEVVNYMTKSGSI